MMSTADEISIALYNRFNCGIASSPMFSNVVLLNSPWESDVLAVSKAYYFTEYEIKLSLADFRADFQKSVRGYSAKSPLKHDLYASGQAITENLYRTNHGELVPKPARFYFVTPAGLLDGVEIPPHCGHLEYHEGRSGYYERVQEAQKAPRLKKPTKLSMEQLYNLATKSAAKAHRYRRSAQTD